MEYKYRNITHFEGLNALRFFAAYLVVLHHAEGIKAKYGLDNFGVIGFFQNGPNAVTFFFVLSGFLITYLLLKEKLRTNTVNVKRFYLKRVLRIWPLYFLLVALGTIILPVCFKLFHIDYQMPYTFGQVWYYFVFFLPGLTTFYYGHHLLEPLWSIGVEEVFYLIWAPLFKFIKRRILAILLTVIILKSILGLLAKYVITDKLFDYIVSTFSFEAMAIGGLGAYFVFHYKKNISELFIYKKPAQVIAYLLLGSYLCFHSNFDNVFWNSLFKVPLFSGFLINFLFLYIIIGVSLVEGNLFKLKNKYFSILGEISYGIYMYHMIVIFAIILIFKNFFQSLHPFLSISLFYIILTISVILVSYISKITFEDFFLRRKHKLEKV